MSGVVLANASLDVAFHDTFPITLFFILSNFLFFPNKDYLINHCKEKVDDEYIKKFWVGLMDGDGSIQVNHCRKKSLQFRLVIKLSNILSNYNMLVLISQVIGGSIRITDKGQSVIWVVNDKNLIKEIIKIFDVYPLLTSVKVCQLNFLKECLLRNSVYWYLLNRNLKYNNQLSIINILKLNLISLPHYFAAWFSGFTEAEGCFSIRKSNNHSFSIGQNYDSYLIHAIKLFIGANNIVRNPYKNFYSLEVYNKDVFKFLIHHFNNFPLLGEKLVSFKKWEQKL